MREMGWSWRELLEAPADLAEEVAVRLSAQAEMTMKKRERDG